MKVKYLFLLCMLAGITLYAPIAGAEEFFYKHEAGDKYRIISTVHEDVYINRVLNHRAEILNRISVEVTDESEGRGWHRAIFQTSERASAAGRTSGRQTSGVSQSFQLTREYESEFERDRLGRLSIDVKYFMPVVRDVPVFPDRELHPGDRWVAEGHEMHDFRDSFGISEPYRIPFMAEYVFLGNREWKGKTYPAFSVSYRIRSEPQAVSGRLWPKRITGASDQIVYWDSDMGQAVAYSEEFRMVLELSDGMTVEYRGRAEAEIVESHEMDKERIAEEINNDLRRLHIQDVTVRVVDEGIAISLDDIQFHADTAEMLPGEQAKLDRIADILLRYQDRDIQVSGHTALAGTAEGRLKLSYDRAAVVADYLLGKKVRTPDRIIVRGYGAEKPRAGNDTEEGRRQNRRVEITILEN